MGKPKSPLLSLEAHGTVGRAFTFQRRSGQDFVREKPSPLDRQSLSQMYHRWRWRHYAYLWTQFSHLEKETWRAIGTPRGLTAFSAYMSAQLLTLPNIAGCWRLDEASGAIALDSSINANYGTYFGPSLVPAIISRGRSFDGVDDYIKVPYHSAYGTLTTFTLLAWVRFASFATAESYHMLLLHRTIGVGGFGFAVMPTGKLRSYTYFAVGAHERNAVNALSLNTWHRIFVMYSGGSLDLGWDKTIDVSYDASYDPDTTTPLYIGSRGPAYGRSHCLIDDVTIYNEVLDQRSLALDYNRRYPL